MRVEVVAVGTELLLGQVVDTNSAWIGEQLALSGLDCLHQSKVGDNLDRIVAEVRQALERADAVILCGGLGPTKDDVTRLALAEVMGVELQRDPQLVERITKMFAGRGRPMPANNLLQADVPEGATVIDQTLGTAPGLICPFEVPGPEGPVTKVAYAVPGVPFEMKDMMERAVLPDLRRRAGRRAAIVSRTLRTWGESESGLDERLAGRLADLDAAGNPTLAFMASGIEGLKVRITAKAETSEEAEALVAAEEVQLRKVLGDLIFGVDDENMECAVGDLLRRTEHTLAIAESLTGGLIGARVSNVPGISGVFKGAIVAYQPEVKFDLLDVPEGPVVSTIAAEAMATGVRDRLRADIGLSVTGVAGPEPQDGQPPGVVFVGMAFGDEVTSRRLQLPGDRDRVRQFTVISALDLLRHRLLAEERGGGVGEPPAVFGVRE